MINCGEIIHVETKTTPTDYHEKYTTCKTQNFYNLLDFLLITLELLVAVSIVCYYLLPFHVINDKLTNKKLVKMN